MKKLRGSVLQFSFIYIKINKFKNTFLYNSNKFIEETVQLVEQI